MAEIVEHPRQARGELTRPVRLTTFHDLGHFDCGKPPLNDWIKNQALNSEGQFARTYVVCSGNVVVGYYCIAMGSVERKQLPSKLKRKQGLPNHAPVAIIGRLARDKSPQWKGLGKDLLQDALIRIVSVSENIGVRCVLVHAIDDEAAQFWKDQEFQEYPDGSRTFFMPIETVIEAMS
ncbi:GNAT family N-acetyltransferase [Bradyrhizobium sp. CCBAU 051011]|uniref:GNAT family N-acetyltransferase n=1 Tax=Bradyrhizobium sp. CCBAU 051011 TaxID=858422 RepID=UPI0013743CDF|nr:GNAT family N-acetyltransferase [Bradyrhizobium sp. CCBAU 051011]QHO77894.1 GNAT family N-acetyltransferase [Bradyrhizobium sp. CCBAU 051011]